MSQSTRLKTTYMIAKFLWDERIRSGKSRVQISWRVGLTPKQILEYEQGVRPIPLYYLAKLAECYQTDLQEMAGYIQRIPSESRRNWYPEEYAKIAHHRLKVRYE